MYPRLRLSVLPLIVELLLAASFAAGPARAAEYRGGAIVIGNPWLRETPKGASVAGGYMTITNTGIEPDRLTGGSASAAARFELHRMVEDKGIARMRPLRDGLEIKPGETIELKPSTLHVMLTGLRQPVEKGQKVKGTLEFEKAGRIEIEYAVEALGAAAPAAGGHRH